MHCPAEVISVSANVKILDKRCAHLLVDEELFQPLNLHLPVWHLAAYYIITTIVYVCIRECCCPLP